MNSQDTEQFDIEEIIAQTAEYIPPPPSDTVPHYGISFLINIPLYQHTGNSAMVDYNRRDADGNVIVNTPYFPRNMLMRFRNLTVSVPAETPASKTTSTNRDAHARPFDPSLAESVGGMITRVEKTARACAELCNNSYKNVGFILLHSLTGIENYQEARRDLLLVLPLNDEKIFNSPARTVLGEKFTGPFLDDILKHLQNPETRNRLDNLQMDEARRNRLVALYAELLSGANNALSIAKGQISETERQMAASPQQKTGYDRRDPQFVLAPEPFDLICLAQRNEKPKDERALEQARVLQETGNQPLNEVAKNMNFLAQQMLEQNQRQTSNPAVGLTPEQIQQMVNDGVKAALAAENVAAETPAEIPAEEKRAKGK